MEFKLNLVGHHPTSGDLVLRAEVPLSGVKFIETFGKALRRSIDHVGRYRHITLGALATYEVSVPQQMAIDSGLFQENDTLNVYVENNLLSYFIFYQASLAYGATGRPCYPYMVNEATLVSLIDELKFLECWANTGYATSLRMYNGTMISAEDGSYDPDGDTSTGGDTGLTPPGCDGCPVEPPPQKPPYGRPPHWHHHPHPKPPRPRPPIGNIGQGPEIQVGAIRFEPVETE